MEQLSISTTRLRLRHLVASDLSDFHAYRSDPKVTQYQSFEPYSLEQAKAFLIENATYNYGHPGEWVQFGIEKINENRLIGDFAIKINPYFPELAEIGISIAHEEQQKGYAKEAILWLLDYLFAKKGIHRVTALTDVKNIASIQLLKSVGFRKEAHFIENVFFKGQWESEYQFALLKREWSPEKFKTYLSPNH